MKWLIRTCKTTPWRAPATQDRAELICYRGVFVSQAYTLPGAGYEEVHVQFWAPYRGGVGRMLKALGLGDISPDALVAEMESVQP